MDTRPGFTVYGRAMMLPRSITVNCSNASDLVKCELAAIAGLRGWRGGLRSAASDDGADAGFGEDLLCEKAIRSQRRGAMHGARACAPPATLVRICALGGRLESAAYRHSPACALAHSGEDLE